MDSKVYCKILKGKSNCSNKNCQSGVINGINPKVCKKCNPNKKSFKQKDIDKWIE